MQPVSMPELVCFCGQAFEGALELHRHQARDHAEEEIQQWRRDELLFQRNRDMIEAEEREINDVGWGGDEDERPSLGRRR